MADTARPSAANEQGIRSVYRALVAHSHATARRRRNRRGTHFPKAQWSLVTYHLPRKWSPEQLSDHLKTHTSFSISHKTIYEYLLKDKKPGGKLYTHLKIRPKQRKKRYNSIDSRGVLHGKRNISTRPAEVETRQLRGHWEGDTVTGSVRFHCVLTRVKRKSGFVIIKKLASRTATLVTAAMREVLKEHGRRFKTITFDNGSEFHDYMTLERSQLVIFYFATPYHSWERGTNENTNGLIRQFLPKGHTMEGVTQAHCDAIALKLNTRPRKRLNYLTPRDKYSLSV